MDKNMKYLPLNINLYDKKVVIYGGGEVAYSKAKILANFCNNITVIAAEFDERFSTLKNITLVKKQIEESDLSDCYSLVICALGQ
jgi:precorrin-2 dehydrogenase / sirohydrochlorin ferrochelatase